VGYFNTNLGRGAMAAYLSCRLHAPLLELGSTVIFLVLTEYTQLVLWAMLGIVGFRAEVTGGLLAAAAGVAAFWIVFFLYTNLHVTPSWLIQQTSRRDSGRSSARFALRLLNGWPRSFCCARPCSSSPWWRITTRRTPSASSFRSGRCWHSCR
jgi:hypothetical protein